MTGRYDGHGETSPVIAELKQRALWLYRRECRIRGRSAKRHVFAEHKLAHGGVIVVLDASTRATEMVFLIERRDASPWLRASREMSA